MRATAWVSGLLCLGNHVVLLQGGTGRSGSGTVQVFAALAAGRWSWLPRNMSGSLWPLPHISIASFFAGAWQSERLGAVLFGTADTLPELRRIDDALR